MIGWKFIAPGLLFISMLATAAVPPVQGAGTSGEQVAEHLNARYRDTRLDCGKPSQPAFLCNGVILRALPDEPNYRVWENSPASKAKGGVSFSYLRVDSKFNHLVYGYDNGYTLMSYLSFDAGPGTPWLKPEIVCFFPIDAGSANRAYYGCGKYLDVAGSRLCSIENVSTAKQWADHYPPKPGDAWRLGQCAFEVTDTLNAGATTAFATGLAAMKEIAGESFVRQNELILKVWDKEPIKAEDKGKLPPVESFFYLRDGPSVNRDQRAALKDAQNNQKRLFCDTKVVVPVIWLKLPATLQEDAVFGFDPSEQAIPTVWPCPQ